MTDKKRRPAVTPAFWDGTRAASVREALTNPTQVRITRREISPGTRAAGGARLRGQYNAGFSTVVQPKFGSEPNYVSLRKVS